MPEARHRLPTTQVAARAGGIAGPHDGTGLRIAVACARFNDQVTTRLLDGALAALEAHGVPAGMRAVA